MAVKNTIRYGSYKFQKIEILFLEILMLLEFLVFGSSLLHSFVVKGKKEFLKKLRLFVNEGIFFEFLCWMVELYKKGSCGFGFLVIFKETKFSIPTSLLKRFKSQFLVQFFHTNPGSKVVVLTDVPKLFDAASVPIKKHTLVSTTIVNLLIYTYSAYICVFEVWMSEA